jgi:hypothetical protein
MTEQIQADPRDIIEAFRERVLQLAEYIREWTAGDPSLRVEITDQDIEDALGHYKVAQVAVSRSGVRIARFVPLSAAVIGAQGRIDVDGPSDRAVILFLEGPGTIETRVGSQGSEAEVRRTPIFRGVRGPGWYWSSDPRSRDVRLLEASTFRSLIAMVADYEII